MGTITFRDNNFTIPITFTVLSSNRKLHPPKLISRKFVSYVHASIHFYFPTIKLFRSAEEAFLNLTVKGAEGN